jgi:hypothetical protein
MYWIECNKRMPEKDGLYLVYEAISNWRPSQSFRIFVVELSDGEWWKDGHFIANPLITHWHPLPEFNPIDPSKGA